MNLEPKDYITIVGFIITLVVGLLNLFNGLFTNKRNVYVNAVTSVKPELRANNLGNMAKFFVYSAIGIFVFFIPVTLNGKSSIMLDHIVSYIQSAVPGVLPYYALLVIILGAVYPFVKGTWKKDTVSFIFSILKVIGLVAGIMLVFNFGPKWFFDPDMGPFLFNKLVVSVGLLVPIGSVFLALLVGYGLLEFVGIFMQPVMRPVWKTPGRSAIDAVASFVGSYSIGLLITNRVFKEGKYTIKEAAIIATGFSTVFSHLHGRRSQNPELNGNLERLFLGHLCRHIFGNRDYGSIVAIIKNERCLLSRYGR